MGGVLVCCAAYRIIVKAGWGWLAGFEASGKGLCSRNMSAGALIHCALCVRYLCRHDGLVAKLFGGGKKQQQSERKPWLQW